ncbi:MAG: O-antigen ligase family protein [Candidatus Paceibacterota bacterium]
MELVPYILLAILTVLMSGPQFRAPYEVLRRALMPLLGVAYLLQWWVEGTSIYLPDMVIWITLGMVGWWIVATLVSPYHYVGVSELSVWTGMVMFIVTAFNGINLTGLGIVMIGIVANCLYAVLQGVFKREPLRNLSNALPQYLFPLGFIGNTNMLGNLMAVSFFLSLLLGAESRWWYLVSALIGYTVWITKCKGSYLGMVVGGLFVLVTTQSDDVYTLLVIMSIGIGMMLLSTGWRHLISDYSKGTLKERLNYWRIAWEQIKLTPGFGLGLDCLKCRIPYIQRDLNNKSNGAFLDPSNYSCPYPQKCHNDYIQMACDVGIPGLVAYLSLIIMALLSDADLLLKGALIAALISGIFMHNLHTEPTNVMIWFVLFACLRGDATYTPEWYIIAGLIIVILSTYKDLIHKTLTEYYFIRAKKTSSVDYYHKAIKHSPTDGFSLVNLGGMYQVANDSIHALHYTMEGINRYDGAIRLWELWLNAAKAQLVLGGLLAAEAYAKKSLEFNPSYKEAREFLGQIQQILLRGYQVKRQMEPKNEPKINGTQPQRIRPDVVNAGSQAAN